MNYSLGLLSLRLALTLVFCVATVESLRAETPRSVHWKIKQLTVDGNEGIDIADFNKDGKLDVVAGRNWYAGPEFVARPVRTIEDWNGYVQSNGDFAYDVDKDGWTDVIAGSFIPTEVHWFKNPGAQHLRLGKMWPKQLLVDTQATTNEGELFEDLDGDGTPEWIVNAWKKDVPMLAWKLSSEQQGGKPTMTRIEIGPKGNGHGMGVGDLNGDGLTDILVGQGWYECPAEGLQGNWIFHPDWDIHVSIPVLIRDLDGDGRNDIVVGQGHNFGLHWWQQMPPAEDGKLQWKQHLIDETFSQPHALHFADLDGDGQDELITGKRFYAHNGGDPGGKHPPCIYYYTWNREKLEFTRHVIERGTVGIGLQIRTADIDGNGTIDIAVAGKSGTHVLLNQGFAE